MTGRPSTFTAELAEQFCRHIADGQTFNDACKSVQCSSSAVSSWLLKHADFAAMYARARMRQADTFADRLIEIVNDLPDDKDAASAARAKIAALTWLAGKRNPRVYGDKLALGGDADQPIEHVFRWKDESPAKS